MASQSDLLRVYRILIAICFLLALYLRWQNSKLRWDQTHTVKVVPAILTRTVIIDNEYLDIVSPSLTPPAYLQGSLHSVGKSLIMYLHYRSDLISSFIFSTNRWEDDLLSQFEAFLQERPGTQLLDVGANLGVYTLTAAALGSKVVAVDANPENTARLVLSLKNNGLQDRAFVCLNAMGDQRRRVVVRVVDGNVGGSNIEEAGLRAARSVDTIFMDDLVPLFEPSLPIAVKMDIEGNEVAALGRASTFFDQRNVTFVMMEWNHIKKNVLIRQVLQFFLSRGFTPSRTSQKKDRLQEASFMMWPYDIFWLKRCFHFPSYKLKI